MTCAKYLCWSLCTQHLSSILFLGGKYMISLHKSLQIIILIKQKSVLDCSVLSISQWRAESVRFKAAGGLNHQIILGLCLRAAVLFSHGSPRCLSCQFLHYLSQHCGNPNISPRFECQTSYTISDKNNGLLQAESQVSERWTNTRQRCFLSKEDDQGGTSPGSNDFQSDI